jgi:hypothetical protein
VKDESKVFKKDVFGDQGCYPCYNIFSGTKEPSVQKDLEIDKNKYQTWLGCASLICSPFLSITALLGIVSLFDAVIMGGREQWSLRINSFISLNSITLVFGLIGSGIIILWMAFKAVVYAVSKFIGQRTPGVFLSLFVTLSTRYEMIMSQKRKLVIVAKIAVRLFLVTTISWIVFLFTCHELFGNVYLSNANHGMGNTVVYVLKAVTSNFFTDLFRLLTMQTEEQPVFTVFGKVLIHILQLSFVYFVIKYVLILWNSRPRKENEEELVV